MVKGLIAKREPQTDPRIEELLELAISAEAQGLDDAQAIRDEIDLIQNAAAVIGLPIRLKA